MKKIHFQTKKPNIGDMYRKAQSTSTWVNINLVNAFTISSYSRNKIDPDLFRNPVNLVDSKPLAKYLKIRRDSRIIQTRGVDYLKDFLKTDLSDTIPTYILTFYKDAKDQFIKLGLIHADSKVSFIILDENQSLAQIPYIGEYNKIQSGIYFICAGTPKQDIISQKFPVNQYGVTMGVGGAIDFVLGLKKEAPLLVQRFYLEWFFRLIQEPRRLIKRYSLDNFFFLLILFKDLVKSQNKSIFEISD